ncbi:MAG: phage tail assembly protein [Paracoccaceae bacterium]
MGEATIRTVELSAPITVDGEEVGTIKLREPKAGELRGLSLLLLLQLDVDAMRKLLPRITMPIVDDHVLAEMPIGDFSALAMGAQGFFAKGRTAPGPGETTSP